MKEGWEEKTLGEVCDILDSKRKPISKSKRETGSIPYYGATGLLDYVKDFIFEEPLVLLGEDGAKWGPGDKSSYRIDGRTWVNNHAHVLRPKHEIILDTWLEYFLNFSDLSDFITGVTVPKLNQEKMKSILIPVPPLAEQQRIVEFLDTAFARIDAVKAKAKENLDHAQALFQAALTEMMTPKVGWQQKPLKEFAKYSIGLTYKPSDVKDNGTIVLRSSNIQNDKLDLNDIVRVDCKVKDSLFVETGDILMCSRNGSAKLVGKVALIPELKEKMTYGTFMMIIRSEYNPYLFYFFKSNEFRSQIKHGEANMINQITRYMLDDVVVNLPPVEEQNSVVDKLNKITDHIIVLQEKFAQLSSECDALKQSLLKQVFE